MSPEYRTGRADGLRMAIDIMSGLEADVARRLERPAGRVTRDARRVRCSAYRVAGTRIRTALNSLERKRSRVLHTALEELGLG